MFYEQTKRLVLSCRAASASTASWEGGGGVLWGGSGGRGGLLGAARGGGNPHPEFFSFFFITLGLELSDTKVYEPTLNAVERVARSGLLLLSTCEARTNRGQTENKEIGVLLKIQHRREQNTKDFEGVRGGRWELSP